MSNLMPGDNSGAEPNEHFSSCRSMCEFWEAPLAEDKECPNGHTDHECNCPDLEADYWDALADSYDSLSDPPWGVYTFPQPRN